MIEPAFWVPSIGVEIFQLSGTILDHIDLLWISL